MEAVLKDVSTKQERVSVIHASLEKQLTDSEVRKLAEVKEKEPDKFRSDASKLWSSGVTLRIGFIGGTAAQRELVKRVAPEWTRFANLTFEFVESGPTEIRVGFESGHGSWSYLGTDALGLPKNSPTMNLDPADQRNVLHEFGHVLGLIEELQNPKARIPWNKERVYRDLSSMSRDEVDRLYFSLPDYSPGEREFDPKSVMTHAVPPEWVKGTKIPGGDELSASDKQLASQLYPRV